MLSPMTPPGTHIVCIDAGPSRAWGRIIPCTLIEGRVYRLGEIVEIDFLLAREGFVALLADHARAPLPNGVCGWSLSRFKPATLPRSIISLLEVAPIKEAMPS